VPDLLLVQKCFLADESSNSGDRFPKKRNC